MVQPIRMGACEKPIHMAFLSGGAMLPRNSLNLGLASISPMLKMIMASTANPTRLDAPKQTSAMTIKTVPTRRLVVARIFAPNPANRKHVSIIMPALMFTMPSGWMVRPLASMPRKNCQNQFCVPSAPKRNLTIGAVSTQSSTYFGSTSQSIGNISHQTEKMSRYSARCGFFSSRKASSARLACFSLPSRMRCWRASRSALPGSR